MKKSVLILFLAVVSCGLFAMGGAEGSGSFESVFKGEYVISAKDVKKDEVILVDARGGRSKLGTIKGAVVISWKELATCADGKPGKANWGCILDKARLDKKLGELGIDMNKPIVVFGQCGKAWGEEGRIVWQLLSVGYKNVKFVDGGYNAMVVAGFKKSFTGTSLEPVKVSTKAIDSKFSIDTKNLKKDYASFKVIDTRADVEYKGATKYGEAKGGKMPNAIQIRFTDLFQDNGLLKSNGEIDKIIKDAGVTKQDKIVAYCTAGIRSAYVQLVMVMLGYDVVNYDESYYRWCNVYDVE